MGVCKIYIKRAGYSFPRAIIGSGNGLSSVRRQAIIWTNDSPVTIIQFPSVLCNRLRWQCYQNPKFKWHCEDVHSIVILVRSACLLSYMFFNQGLLNNRQSPLMPDTLYIIAAKRFSGSPNILKLTLTTVELTDSHSLFGAAESTRPCRRSVKICVLSLHLIRNT